MPAQRSDIRRRPGPLADFEQSMNLVLDGYARAAKVRRYDFKLGHDRIPRLQLRATNLRQVEPFQQRVDMVNES